MTQIGEDDSENASYQEIRKQRIQERKKDKWGIRDPSGLPLSHSLRSFPAFLAYS
jgi:hypothetical protein